MDFNWWMYQTVLDPKKDPKPNDFQMVWSLIFRANWGQKTRMSSLISFWIDLIYERETDAISPFNTWSWNLNQTIPKFLIHPSYTRKEKLGVFNDKLASCLGLIKTLFWARIQGLFGLGYGPFTLGFLSQFWGDLI
jgi:hypothetical protein